MNEIKRLKIIVMGHEKRLAILEGRQTTSQSEPAKPSDGAENNAEESPEAK